MKINNCEKEKIYNFLYKKFNIRKIYIKNVGATGIIVIMDIKHKYSWSNKNFITCCWPYIWTKNNWMKNLHCNINDDPLIVLLNATKTNDIYVNKTLLLKRNTSLQNLLIEADLNIE